MSTLEIRGLRVSVEDKEILQGVDLSVSSGETHAIMGPTVPGSRPSRTPSRATRSTP